MPRLSRPAALLTATFIVLMMSTLLAPTPALADETGVIKARLALDAVERSLPRLADGDVASGNKLLARINDAAEALKGCKDKAAESWQAQLARAKKLDAEIRAKLGAGGGGSGSGGGETAPSAPSSDTKKAAALLDEVDAAFPSLAAGDVSAGNVLIKKVNDAIGLLSKADAKAREGDFWKRTAARTKPLDGKIRARLAEKPAPGATPKPAPKETPKPAPSGGAEAGPLTRGDQYTFDTRFAAKMDKLEKELAATAPEKVALKKNNDYFMTGARNLLAVLKGLKSQDHPTVKASYTRLQSFVKNVDAKTTDGIARIEKARATAAAESKLVDEELAKIEAFFERKKDQKFHLEPPFGELRMRKWIEEIKGHWAIQKKGLAQLQRLVKEHPDYAKGNRVGKLRHIFETYLPTRLTRGINRTVGWFEVSAGKQQSDMLFRIANGKKLIENEFKESWLADDKWVEKALVELEQGAEAARAMVIWQKEYYRKDDPEHAKLATALIAATRKLDEAAKRVIADTRMPEQRGDASLAAIAKKLLTDKKVKYGVGPYRRLVVNSKKQRESAEREEAREEGSYLVITKWTETWDHFQVCLAEEVDGTLRLVYYSFKYFVSAPKWKTRGEWFCSDRIVSRRILPENVDK